MRKLETCLREAASAKAGRHLLTVKLRGFKFMRGLTFLYGRQFPLTLNVRILKLWNPAVCPVFLWLRSITTQSLRREVALAGQADNLES